MRRICWQFPRKCDPCWRSAPKSIVRHSRCGVCAFTLVELLVVVAIIALLLGILVPALGHAREVARGVACLSHLGQVGNAVNTYAAEHNNYIPGPNTSGHHISLNRPGRPPNHEGRTEPITPDDWMSPLFGNSLGLSDDRNERLLQLFNHRFRCPSNPHKYDYIYPTGAGWPDASTLTYNSYSSPLTLHNFQNAAHMQSRGYSYGSFFGSHDVNAVDVTPARHNFRLQTLGPLHLKVAAMDGARYINPQGEISFNVDQGSAWGGNFMNRGPTLNVYYQENGNPYKFAAGSRELHEHSARFSYRHVNKTMNMVFYDGHAETLGNEDSRKIDFYYPRGSVVNDPSLIGDPNVTRGQIVN